MSLGNPAGAWALLGLLAVLAIHLLQRRLRRARTATLFLMPAVDPVSQRGSALERLRASASLFLQLAAVLVLAWLLVAPRFVRPESVQRVAVVLDSSASMGAFRAEAEGAAVARLGALDRLAGRTEWVVMESALRRGRLYAGSDPGAAARALASWDPVDGGHDLGPALQSARALVGPEGRVLLVTDHVTDVAPGVERLAVGRPSDTVGVVAASATGDAWRVVVRNHGRSPARRAWTVEVGGGRRPGGALELDPGQARVLGATFPPGADAVEIDLEPDAFALDDRVVIVRPAPKPLKVAVSAGARALPFLPRLLEALLAEPAEAGADLGIRLDRESAGPGPALVLSTGGGRRLAAGAVAGSAHPLVADLSWMGLLVPEGSGVARAPGDEVLLWQERRPLVALRGEDLLVGFDPSRSNADRLPAFVLLLHRFAEGVRARKVAPARSNGETQQLLAVAHRPEPSLEISHDGGAWERVERDDLLRAPGRPGLLRVRQGDVVLLTAGIRFADAREADLTGAGAVADGGDADQTSRERTTREDPLAPLWVLALAGLLLADWRLS